MNPARNQIYKHFKGNLYKILHIAKDSENLEPVVVYQALYGDNDIWTRTLSNFIQTIEKDGKFTKRFERIFDNDKEAKFLAIFKQKHEGCDYTIGCGLNYTFILEDNITDAKSTLKKIVKEEYSVDSDRSLSKIILISCSDIQDIDPDMWYSEFRKEKSQEEQSQIEKKERELLQKLKQKYEKTN